MISLDELCAKHYANVYKRARFLTGDDDTALDVTQEVFYRVTRWYATLKHERGIPAWLWLVTTNVVRDMHKKAQCRIHPLSMDALTYSDSGKTNELWHPHSEQDAIHDRLELKDLLRDTCADLTDKQRMCFQAQLLGYTYREISAASGMSQSAVKMHLSRANRRARERHEREQRAS